MKLEYTNEAKTNLVDIKNYISLDSANQAEKVILKILKMIENIVLFPDSGTYLSNRINCNKDLKYKMVYSYAIIYKIKNDAIYIISIKHLKQDLSKIKFNK